MAITSNVKVSELAPVETVSSTTLFPVSVVSSIDAEGLPVFLSKKTSLGQMSSYIGSYLLANQSFVDSLCYAIEGNNDFMGYVDNHVSSYLTESLDFIDSITYAVSVNPDIMMGDAIILSWKDSIEETKLTVPDKYRRRNLIVSYSYKEEKDGKIKEINVTEKYIGNEPISDSDWIDSNNWTSLAGGNSSVTISYETIYFG